MATLDPQHISCLLEFIKKINSTLNQNDLLVTINQELVRLFGIEASYLLMLDPQKQELYFQSANEPEEKIFSGVKISIEGSLAGWVILNQQAVFRNHADKDSWHDQQMDGLFDFTIRNLAAVPLVVKGEITGVLEVINKFNGRFNSQETALLQELACYIAIALENAKIYEHTCHQLKSSFAAFSNAIDKRDSYTHFHSERVRDYAVIISGKKDLAPPQCENLELAAILHDIGKIGIRDNILLKPSHLTSQEFTLIKDHPLKGAEILSLLEGISSEIVNTVRHHHEKWNGGGYPDGLSGEKIPFLARIITICDVFDALTTDRPYRPRMSTETAKSFIIENKNLMFDPDLVDVFQGVYPEMVTKGNLS
jgi:HD-GYP domain-containing protein (c-di-GMP phosphodiesterase class II)